MSVGRWIARTQKPCTVCRELFTPTGPNARYCPRHAASSRPRPRRARRDVVIDDGPEALSELDLTRPSWLIESLRRLSDAELVWRAEHPMLPHTGQLAREELARRHADGARCCCLSAPLPERRAVG